MGDIRFTLPRWYDLHAHFRQGPALAPLIAAHLAMGCAGVLAMPNTRPPVGKLWTRDPPPYWSIEEYRRMLTAAGADAFRAVIVPLYLTSDTTPAMIEEGAKAGILTACKYYPPHGTTGAEHSAAFEAFMRNGVFRAMEECGVILCAHGEEHGMRAEDYFAPETNAEAFFYRERMPRAADAFPKLKMVAEHLTTKAGVDFVHQAGGRVGATVTPQHLLYTVGHLVQGLKYHLYCMPLVKFEEDREALRSAVTAIDNNRFFAGTDSAPHTAKATACGCAAGCFTGGIAAQLYAEAFEQSGIDLSGVQGQQLFKRFLCDNGAAFYDLPRDTGQFALVRKPQRVLPLKTPDGAVIPLPLGLAPNLDAAVSVAWSVE